MSNKYKIGDYIPSDVICKRLEVLADAVTKGRDAINREFDIRIPAERDHDADLVLIGASVRIRSLEEQLHLWESSCDEHQGNG